MCFTSSALNRYNTKCNTEIDGRGERKLLERVRNKSLGNGERLNKKQSQNKVKYKHNLPEPLGYKAGSPKREVYTYQCSLKSGESQINSLIIHPEYFNIDLSMNAK